MSPWPQNDIVVVLTDLWGKELHRQVCVGIVVMSERVHGVMVAHWPGMPEMWVRVPLLAQYFPFSSHPRHIHTNYYNVYIYLDINTPTEESLLVPSSPTNIIGYLGRTQLIYAPTCTSCHYSHYVNCDWLLANSTNLLARLRILIMHIKSAS